MSDTTFRDIIESRKIKKAADRIARIQAFLDLGVDINIRDPRGRTALFIACAAGQRYTERPHPAEAERFELARFLLSHGADPNTPDKFGATPLHEVASNNDVELARIIIEEGTGADVNARDQYGSTPLHEACANGYPEIARFLLSHGANPRIVDRDGTDPLKLAQTRVWDPIWYPQREELLDLFREFHPELVMEKYVAGGLGL